MGKLIQELAQAISDDPEVKLYETVGAEIDDLNKKLETVEAGFCFERKAFPGLRSGFYLNKVLPNKLFSQVAYIRPSGEGSSFDIYDYDDYLVGKEKSIEDTLLYIKNSLLSAVDVPTKAKLNQQQAGSTKPSPPAGTAAPG